MNCTDQKAVILTALQKGQSLTHVDSLRIGGGYKLSTRVGELKSAGHKIGSNWIKRHGRRVKLYWLAKGK